MENEGLKFLQEYHLQVLINKIKENWKEKGIAESNISTFGDVLSNLHYLVTMTTTDDGYQATFLNKEVKMLLVRYIDPLCKINPEIVWNEKEPSSFEVFVHFRYSWMDEDFVTGYERGTFNPRSSSETLDDYVKMIRGSAISSTLSDVLSIGMRDKADILTLMYEEEKEKALEDKIKAENDPKPETTKKRKKKEPITDINSLPTGKVQKKNSIELTELEILLTQNNEPKLTSSNTSLTKEDAINIVPTPEEVPTEMRGMTLGDIFAKHPYKLDRIYQFSSDESVKAAIKILVKGTVFESMIPES